MRKEKYIAPAVMATMTLMEETILKVSGGDTGIQEGGSGPEVTNPEDPGDGEAWGDARQSFDF